MRRGWGPRHARLCMVGWEADLRAEPPASSALDRAHVPNSVAVWSVATKTKMKTLIVHYHSFELWHAPSWIRERLQQDFPDHQFIQLQNYERVPEEIADTDVFI